MVIHDLVHNKEFFLGVLSDEIADCAISANTVVVAVSHKGDIKVWNGVDGSLIYSAPMSGDPPRPAYGSLEAIGHVKVSISLDGTVVALALSGFAVSGGGRDNRGYVFIFELHSRIFSGFLHEEVFDCALSGDGYLVLSVSPDGLVCVNDWTSFKQLSAIRVGSIGSCGWSWDCKKIYLAGPGRLYSFDFLSIPIDDSNIPDLEYINSFVPGNLPSADLMSKSIQAHSSDRLARQEKYADLKHGFKSLA